MENKKECYGSVSCSAVREVLSYFRLRHITSQDDAYNMAKKAFSKTHPNPSKCGRKDDVLLERKSTVANK